MQKLFVIHYGEIGIKGKNRILFEDRLVQNVRKHLAKLGKDIEVKRRPGRIIIDGPDVKRPSQRNVKSILQQISGIEYFMEAVLVEPTFEAIAAAARELFKDAVGTFRATVKRADKRFPMTSQEAAAALGAELLRANKDLRVDLHRPDRVCYAEITSEGAYVAGEKVRGAGGLPVGSGGRLLSLISGGIDSPVASWMMLRRGAPLHYLHFHNFPYTGRESIDIVRDALAVLNRNGFSAGLSLVNLTPVQEEIVAACAAKFRVVLYRRMMFRIAERIALGEGAVGLVTGESLGQVASQTAENMCAVEAVTPLPVFRPLIGMDKTGIVDMAKKIGTYEISIRPHSDCCSLFVPDQPATKARIDALEREEAKLDVPALVEKALSQEERLEVSEIEW